MDFEAFSSPPFFKLEVVEVGSRKIGKWEGGSRKIALLSLSTFRLPTSTFLFRFPPSTFRFPISAFRLPTSKLRMSKVQLERYPITENGNQCQLVFDNNFSQQGIKIAKGNICFIRSILDIQ